MRIEGLGPIGQPGPKDKKNDKTAGPVNTPIDKVDLSQKNKKTGEAGYGESLKKALAAQAGQLENSNQIRQRTASGYYEETEVLKTISDKLIDSGELKDVVKEYQQLSKLKSIQSTEKPIRQDKVAEARKKMENGYYNDPTNFDSFAQKIIDHFGL
ncbi:MAG: flagellar biosynthesis anti-sigma factor FlgM [candidate division Zixibacteria bacterium]|nr:flagellar biosynthesis anti-sigma factor FlgM [candidate division Zixibacteria bacterium]